MTFFMRYVLMFMRIDSVSGRDVANAGLRFISRPKRRMFGKSREVTRPPGMITEEVEMIPSPHEV